MTDGEINEKARAIICAALRDMLHELERAPCVLDVFEDALDRHLLPAMARLATMVKLDVGLYVGLARTEEEQEAVTRLAQIQAEQTAKDRAN
jgi:pyridoxine 5'-phosphate synthase PdxJ